MYSVRAWFELMVHCVLLTSFVFTYFLAVYSDKMDVRPQSVEKGQRMWNLGNETEIR